MVNWTDPVSGMTQNADAANTINTGLRYAVILLWAETVVWNGVTTIAWNIPGIYLEHPRF